MGFFRIMENTSSEEIWDDCIIINFQFSFSFSLATLCFWRNVIWNRKFDVTSDVIVFFNSGKLLKQPSMLATLIFIRWVNADFICAEVFFWLEIRVSYCQVGYGVSNSGVQNLIDFIIKINKFKCVFSICKLTIIILGIQKIQETKKPYKIKVANTLNMKLCWIY